jgi:hypothetical protein
VSDDIHLFRSADDGRVSSGAISCDGATALLSRDPSGQTTRFALAEGRSLTQGNQVLVNSPSQVTAAFSTWSSYEVRGGSRLPKAEPGRFFGTMSLHEKSQVRFWCPFVPARVLLNGQPAAAFTFDPKSGLCSIELPEGPHSLELFAQ